MEKRTRISAPVREAMDFALDYRLNKNKEYYTYAEIKELYNEFPISMVTLNRMLEKYGYIKRGFKLNDKRYVLNMYYSG